MAVTCDVVDAAAELLGSGTLSEKPARGYLQCRHERGHARCHVRVGEITRHADSNRGSHVLQKLFREKTRLVPVLQHFCYAHLFRTRDGRLAHTMVVAAAAAAAAAAACADLVFRATLAQ